MKITTRAFEGQRKKRISLLSLKKILFLKKIFLLFFSIPILHAAPHLTNFENLVDQLATKHHLHGNILVLENGEKSFSKSYGLALSEWAVPHTLDSKFMIASLSKSFTAALILILNQQNKLSLDDPIEKYIPLPPSSPTPSQTYSQVTLRQLLQHTSGIQRDFSSVPYRHRSSYDLISTSLPRLLMKRDIFWYQPKEQYSYSNLAYTFLALAAEQATHSYFKNLLKENILYPLKIKNTGEYHRRKVLSSMASGYFYNEDGQLTKRCCDDATVLTGAAHMYSTASDLASWLLALSQSQKHFGFDLLEEMTKNLVPDQEGEFYGYGLMVNASKNIIFHTGHEWGYYSYMGLDLKKKKIVVVLLNRHNMYTGNLAKKVGQQLISF